MKRAFLMALACSTALLYASGVLMLGIAVMAEFRWPWGFPAGCVIWGVGAAVAVIFIELVDGCGAP